MVADNTGGKGTYDPNSNVLIESTTATPIARTVTSVRSIDYGSKSSTTGGLVGGTTIRGGVSGTPNRPSAYSVPAPSTPSGELDTSTYLGNVSDLNPADRRQQSVAELDTIHRASIAQGQGDILYSQGDLLFRGKSLPQAVSTDAYTPFYTTNHNANEQTVTNLSPNPNIDLTKNILSTPSSISKYVLPTGLKIQDTQAGTFMAGVENQISKIGTTLDFGIRQPVRSIVDLGGQGLNFISDLNKQVGSSYGTTDLSKTAIANLPSSLSKYSLSQPISFNDNDYLIPFTNLAIGTAVITEGVGLLSQTGASTFRGLLGTGNAEDTQTALIIGGGALFPELSAPLLLGFGGETLVQGFKEGGTKGTAEVLLGGAMLYAGVNEFNQDFKLSGSDLKVYDKFANEDILSDLKLRERPSGYFFTEDVTGARKYLLGLDKYGNYISPGGKLEVGETALQGLLRETKEETKGTISEDILSNLKYEGTVKTPEEIQQVFTAQLPQDILSIVKPGSDIQRFELVDASKLKDIFQSKENIVRGEYYSGYFDKLLNNPKNIRIAEINVINRIENIRTLSKEYGIENPITFDKTYTKAIDSFSKIKSIDISAYSKKELVGEYLLYNEGKLTKQLGIKTPKGILEFYTQSRYDTPLSTQEKYFQEQIKKFTYTKGAVQFQGETLNLSGNKDVFSSEIQYSIRGEQKAFKNPQLLVSGTAGELQLNKLGYLEIKPELSKRGGAGFYFQTPTTPSGRGYIGSSYFLGGESEYKLSLFPKAEKSTVLYGKFVLDDSILKYADKIKSMRDSGLKPDKIQEYVNKLNKEGKISATAKTVLGIEEEVAMYKGSFRFEGKVQNEILQGRVTEFKNIRRIAPSKEITDLYKARDNAGVFGKTLIEKQIERRTGISPSEFEKPNLQTKYISIGDKLLYGSERQTKKEVFRSPKEFYSPLEKNKSLKETYKISTKYSSTGEAFRTPKENIRYGERYKSVFKPQGYEGLKEPARSSSSARRKGKEFNLDYFNKGVKEFSKRKGGKEDIAYAPSFTAQVLNIKQFVSKSDIFKQAGRSRTGAEFRGILITK